MPKLKFTAAVIERLKPLPPGRIDFFDKILPAFGIRVSANGIKSWFLITRIDGKQVRLTLGRYPMLSLADARGKARIAIEQTSIGIDPREVMKKQKQARQLERKNTFELVAQDFLVRHASTNLRPSTQREYRRILTGRDTVHWKEKPISEITKRDVMDVLDAIRKRGSKGIAENYRAYLSKFFNWCADRDLIEITPTERIKRERKAVKRDRVLSESELARLWPVLVDENSLFGKVLQLQLLLGQRLNETAGMRIEELKDLDTDQALWQIPGNRTKNHKSHLVPLPQKAIDIILSCPAQNGFIFTTTGRKPISGFGRAKCRIDAQLQDMDHWTIHDLRRTMVTIMNEKLSIPPHVVEAIVNHLTGAAKIGVAGTYNRALYLEERRAALNEWSNFLHSKVIKN